MRSWLSRGNKIVEVWCCDHRGHFGRRSSSWAEWIFPEFSAPKVAQRANIPVRLCPPLKSWTGCTTAAKDSKADVLITAMTLAIVPPALLNVFGARAVNIHPALLPHYRGPTPRRGMLTDNAADIYGGVTLHVLGEQTDRGPIIGQRACPRSKAINFFDWDHMLATEAAELVAVDLMAYLDGALEPVPQDCVGSYRRLEPSETIIDSSHTSREVSALFDRIGMGYDLYWKDTASGQLIPVSAVKCAKGSPRGAPTVVSSRSIEAELKDARIILHRKTRWTKLQRSTAKIHAMWRHRQSYR